jgi:hypothetical protein
MKFGDMNEENRRWVAVAVAGAGLLAAALIAVFVVRRNDDKAETPATNPPVTSVVPTTDAVTSVPPSTEPATTTSATTAPASTEPASTEPTVTEPITVPPSTVATTAPATAPDTAGPTTTTPPVAATTQVPAGIVPFSVSFGSSTDGWMSGHRVSDAGGEQTQTPVFLRTTDGGAHWSSTTLPGQLGASGEPATVAFADAANGLVSGVDDNGNDVVFVTHDAGANWALVTLATDRALDPVDVGAGAGALHVVAFDNDATAFKLFVAPLGTDQWAESPATLQPGAGPVYDGHFAFGGSSGWYLYNDRGLKGAARFADGQWTEWTVPCEGDDASAAASPDAAVLVLTCRTTDFAGPPISTAVYTSTDLGATFTPAAELPMGSQADVNEDQPPSIGFTFVPADNAIVIGYQRSDGVFSIVLSNDDGQSWGQAQSYASSPDAPIQPAAYSVPGSPQQLVVVTGPGEGSVSNDSGASWPPATAVDPT